VTTVGQDEESGNSATGKLRVSWEASESGDSKWRFRERGNWEPRLKNYEVHSMGKKKKWRKG